MTAADRFVIIATLDRDAILILDVMLLYEHISERAAETMRSKKIGYFAIVLNFLIIYLTYSASAAQVSFSVSFG